MFEEKILQDEIMSDDELDNVAGGIALNSGASETMLGGGSSGESTVCSGQNNTPPFTPPVITNGNTGNNITLNLNGQDTIGSNGSFTIKFGHYL